MIKQNILIIGAHLDDIEYGMGGTALKHVHEDKNVFGISFCAGNTPNREDIKYNNQSLEKLNVFNNNMKSMKFRGWRCFNHDDQQLQNVDYNVLVNNIQECISSWCIDIVYTTPHHDVNVDHRVTADVTRVACRPRKECDVRKLYEYTLPGSTEWSDTPFNYNTVHDITLFHKQKLKYISNYTTEVRDHNDPLSIEGVTIRDKYNGSIFGMDYAEVFRVIYDRYH